MDIRTSQPGLWSDPATWGGKVPTGDKAIIDHDVILDVSVTVSGIVINKALTLHNEKTITLASNQNITVYGLLVSLPNPNVTHTIRFTGINENNFVGGGMDVLDSDVGLWVMDVGQLMLKGIEKTAWVNEDGPIPAQTTMLKLKDKVNAWMVGDELLITPTEKGASNYDVVTIKSVSSDGVLLNQPTTSHPLIANRYTAEVANLTRNMRIEGTATGQSHIFIHSTAVQTIRYVALRFMGPRKQQRGTTAKEFVVGRYAVHFHHCGDITGSVIEGCVARNSASHVFVPHGSHGINFLRNVTYNTHEHAFWYDPGHSTHNNKWNYNLVAKLNYVSGSINMSLAETDPDTPPTFSAGGFMLGEGDGNECIGNVVVGAVGDPHDGGGYQWPARDENKNEGVWVFKDNLAHNCSCGLPVWQNTPLNHVITNYQAYSNTLDIFHGAYANSYTYNGGFCNGLVEFKAASVNSSRVRVIGMELNQVDMLHSPLAGALPMLFLNCKINALNDMAIGEVHSADIVNCSVGSIKVTGSSLEVLRVQPATGQPYKVTKAGKSNITPFAPTLWGNGTGLKGEYFADISLNKKVLDRTDSYIGFSEWGNGIHYLLTTKISVRWTGFVEPQFSEIYTFTLNSAGKAILWLNEKEINGPILMQAGKKYQIVVVFSNDDDNIRGGVNLLWSCPSLEKFSPGGEYVPQSQLYPDTIIQPPINQPPIADAGADQLISVGFTLTGKGTDSDGVVVSYKWEQVSGAACVIASPSSQNTAVVPPGKGDYKFRLTVTDDKGATGVDEVVVSVK